MGSGWRGTSLANVTGLSLLFCSANKPSEENTILSWLERDVSRAIVESIWRQRQPCHSCLSLHCHQSSQCRKCLTFSCNVPFLFVLRRPLSLSLSHIRQTLSPFSQGKRGHGNNIISFVYTGVFILIHARLYRSLSASIARFKQKKHSDQSAMTLAVSN